MPRITPEIKELISKIQRKDLEKLLLKAVSKDKGFYDFLIVNYLNKESGEQDLFDQAKSDLDRLFTKCYKGFSKNLQMANMLSACIKRINEFSKVCKNKNLEADLIIYALEIPFSYKGNFGTCFTALDHKVGLMVNRLFNLVTKKMHEDYLAEYKDNINYYLKILHSCSNHVSVIYKLPDEI
jgi:hypothetical protein